MRKNKEIDSLTEMAKTVPFPQKPDYRYGQYFSALREVVDHNLGPDARKTLDWDEYSQTFYFELSESASLGFYRGSFQATFTLDPKKPLHEELQRLKDDIERFQMACTKTIHTDEKEREVRESLGDLKR